MIEIVIHGRGGQGGVTLAKLIATAYFLRGKHVQAFGLYAAERSGAPIQAFVRIDEHDITNHNQIRSPDHVIVLDRTLIGPSILPGLKPGGLIILNAPTTPDAFADVFAGRRVATIDAAAIATAHGLGTQAVPIVNTTMLGAAGRAFGLSWSDVEQALAEQHFAGSNVTAAREAFDAVQEQTLPGRPSCQAAPSAGGRIADLLDVDTGGPPRIRTGAWATQQPQRRTLTPPCNHDCPAGNDVQGFLAVMAGGDNDAALGILLKTSPLPGVCGRVCPAPCMKACNRRGFDGAVNVRELERTAADLGKRTRPTPPWRAEEIGVVGSGPAGLSAAYHVARLGYPVTLIEGDEALGGLLRTGIPAFRLPPTVLDAEISHILQHGVKTRLNERVDRWSLLELTRRFAAVVVAAGLQEVRSLDLGAESDGVVEEGLRFLDRTRRNPDRLDGSRVIVIGGGNTAFDAARSARRLGAAQVHVVYRRTRDEMPALAEEILDALEEGVRIQELVSPVRIHRTKAGVMLTCQRMRLGEPDATGRPQPVPETSEDAWIDLACDRVILALGQDADQSILPEGAEVRHERRVLGLTTAPVFFCGDFATGEGTVAGAIGSGRVAAWHVHRTLSGESLFPASTPPVATPDVVHFQHFQHAPRHEGLKLPPRWRTRSFVEVRRGFRGVPGAAESPSSIAVAEARRCMSCGVCNACDRCMEHCPEGIVRRDGVGYHFDYEYCKGCGICATQCPRGVVYMTHL